MRPVFSLQIAAILILGVSLAEQSFRGVVAVCVLQWACIVALDVEGRAARKRRG